MRNELRKAQLDMYHLQKLVPPAMKGTEMIDRPFSREPLLLMFISRSINIRKRVTEAKKAYEEGKRPVPAFCKKDTAYRMSDRWRDPEGGKCDRK